MYVSSGFLVKKIVLLKPLHLLKNIVVGLKSFNDDVLQVYPNFYD